jgi:hypothetical protein
MGEAIPVSLPAEERQLNGNLVGGPGPLALPRRIV